MRIINGLVTVGFFPFLFKIYRKNSLRFYLLWGIGFFLYGFSIIIRALLPVFRIEDLITTFFFSFPFHVSGFIFIITGIGDLVGKARDFLLSVMVLPLSIFFLYIVSGPENIGRAISLSPYIFISVSLLYIKKRYSVPIELLVLGWMILLLGNIAYPMNMMDAAYVEILAIFGKLVIYTGMTYPRFYFLVDDLKWFLISGLPKIYPDETLGSFTLLNSNSNKRSEEIQWLNNRVQQNMVQAVRTILITTYDLISPTDLKCSGMDETQLYLIRMMPSGRDHISVFEEHVMKIHDDLNALDVFFSEIINFSKERKINCEIILYNLSILIHIHGWKRIYTFILSKIPHIKASKVSLYAFYYPGTHNNKADIEKFEKLAENVFTIKV